MTKQRILILIMLFLASGFALLWGLAQARSARGTVVDYRVVYTGARCLVQHLDPYSGPDNLRVYFAEGGERVAAPKIGQRQDYAVEVQLYPPPAELLFVPFALLDWSVSYPLWVGLTFCLLTVAAFLMWNVAQQYAADQAFYLACFILINSGVSFAGANPGGVAVGLCVIAVFCILQQRYLVIGAIALALSLAIKPHDAGPIWLYLVLLGGAARRRAMESLAILLPIVAASVPLVARVSPHWLQEMRYNMERFSTGGSHNDPAATGSMMVNLQAVFAFFRNDPHFYNIAAYAICAPLFLVLVYMTLRGPHTPKAIWLGLAAMAALSLLPLYHRPYDAKILLLTLPGCAALSAEGGLIAWMALGFTSAGIFITSDLPLAALNVVSLSIQNKTSIGGELLFWTVARPAGPVVLAMCVFYTWAFFRCYKTEHIVTDFRLPESASGTQPAKI